MRTVARSSRPPRRARGLRRRCPTGAARRRRGGRHVPADGAQSCPRKPLGVQLASPMRPPGRRRARARGRALLVGREHDPEGRERDVEARVRERQVFGVRPGRSIASPSASARRRRAPGARARSRRRSPSRNGAPPRASRCRCRRPRRARARPLEGRRLAQRLADDLQRRADHREVARRPHRLLARLDRAERSGSVARSDGTTFVIYFSS